MGRRRRKGRGGNIGFKGSSPCPKVLIPKITLSTDELIDMRAALRPNGWFIMFANQKYPSIVCPICGEISALQGNHKIGPDGIVTPSIVCPNEAARCTFHVFGKLEGWEEEEPLDEQTLRTFMQSDDAIIKEMAHEILHLRRELKEHAVDEFREMVVLACLGYNLGHEICRTLQVPIATVKGWALGREKPLAADEERTYKAITSLVSQRMKDGGF